MNPDIPLLLRPFAGRLASLISSLVLACVVKLLAILAAKSPMIAALIDPNQVADCIMIALLAGINMATNHYHIGQYTQPVADALAAEQEKLKPVNTEFNCPPKTSALPPSTQPPSAGFALLDAMISISVAGIIAAALLCFTGCANYAGPTISFTAGYEGISAGFTLFGRVPIAPVPQTVADAFPLPSSGK